MACGPGHPGLSKSYMGMASKLFTFMFTFTQSWIDWGGVSDEVLFRALLVLRQFVDALLFILNWGVPFVAMPSL